jgi:hypothetical protein
LRLLDFQDWVKQSDTRLTLKGTQQMTHKARIAGLCNGHNTCKLEKNNPKP